MQHITNQASATLYDDTPKMIGSMVCVECYENAFHIEKLNWGAEEDYERNRKGEVEQSWTVKGEALESLKKSCNNAKTPEEVVEYLKERFAKYEHQAHYELLNWLEKKQITFYFNEC